MSTAAPAVAAVYDRQKLSIPDARSAVTDRRYSAEQKRALERAAEVQRIIAILHKWGVHTLGQFAALPQDEVGNRLGLEAVRMWERATGTATRVLKLVQPPESFAESFEFENEIETIEPLLFMLRRFLQQLTLRLSALYFVVKELKLCIHFSDKGRYEHIFKIPQPGNNVEVLFRMLHTHLEDFKSEAPIVSVSLEAQPGKSPQQQFSLFETALRDPTQLAETLARLTGLLGAERVGTPVLEDTHRPDALRMEPFTWELPASGADEQRAPSFALRRFRSHVPASVLLAKEKPMHLQSSETHGPIAEQQGPYFVSGNWWDENRWARAEWDLQLANGTLCRCHQHEQGWAVDGIYD